MNKVTHKFLSILMVMIMVITMVPVFTVNAWADPATIYVDADSTADTPDGTESKPYKTIQAAVNAASDGDTIHVKSGNYNVWCPTTSPDNYTGRDHNLFIGKNISIIGEDNVNIYSLQSAYSYAFDKFITVLISGSHGVVLDNLNIFPVYYSSEVSGLPTVTESAINSIAGVSTLYVYYNQIIDTLTCYNGGKTTSESTIENVTVRNCTIGDKDLDVDEWGSCIYFPGYSNNQPYGISGGYLIENNILYGGISICENGGWNATTLGQSCIIQNNILYDTIILNGERPTGWNDYSVTVKPTITGNTFNAANWPLEDNGTTYNYCVGARDAADDKVFTQSELETIIENNTFAGDLNGKAIGIAIGRHDYSNPDDEAYSIIYAFTPVASITSGSATTNYPTLQAAYNAAQDGDTIDILANCTTEAFEINKKITIDGHNHTVSGWETVQYDEWGYGLAIDVYSKVTIKNIVFDGFACGEEGTNIDACVLAAYSGSDLTVTNCAFKNFNRQAITFAPGGVANMTVANCSFDCTPAKESFSIQKAMNILPGTASDSVTIKNCTITNANSSSDKWSSAGIEIFGGTVNIEDCLIERSEYGVYVVRDYYTGYGNEASGYDVDVDVTIKGNTRITESSYPVVLICYQSDDTDAIVKIQDGQFTGTVYRGKTNSYNKNVNFDKCQLVISGGIYSTEPAVEYIASGYVRISNPDSQTKAEYPYKVVPAVTVSGISMSKESYTYGDTVATSGTAVATKDSNPVAISNWTYTYYKNDGTDLSPNWTKLTAAPTDAGSYKLVVATDDLNYSGSQEISFTVNPKAITIAAIDNAAVVGDDKPAFSYSVLGLLGSDELTETPELICSDAPVSSNKLSKAGTYAITVSGGAVGSNYTIAARSSGELTVLKSSQNSPAKGEGYNIIGTTLTAENGYELYDGTNTAASFEITAGTSYFVRRKEVADQKFASGYTSIDTYVAIGALAYPSAMGTVKITGVTNGKCQIGSTVTVSATPKSGYEFVEWRDATGSKIEGAAASYQFTAIAGNTLTAVFKEKNKVVATLPTVASAQSRIYSGNIIIGVSGGAGCTLSGTTEASAVGTYTATATLEDGYVWPDGTSDPKSITWSITPQIQDAPQNLTASNMVISPVTDAMEYKLSTADEFTSVPAGSTSVAVTASGTYYVRMKETDNALASKIAVVIVEKPTITVTTLQPANLTTNGAIFTGNVDNFDIDRVKSEWFQLYCKATGGTQWQVKYGKTGSDAVAQNFQDTISSLTPDTEYEIRAYVKYDDNSIAFGPYITFRTPNTPDPSVTLGTIQASATVEGATAKKVIISVEEGNDVIASAISENEISAGSTFTASFENLPDGNYNVVVRTESGEFTETRRITIENGATVETMFTIPVGKLATVVDVKTEETPKVAVEGLADILTVEDKNSAAIGTKDVEIKLEVQKEATTADETVADTTAYAVAQIEKLIPDATSTLEEKIETVLDLSLIKTTTELENNVVKSVEVRDIGSENSTIIEVSIPYDTEGKTLKVYRYHDGNAEELTALGSRPSANYIDGMYFVGDGYVFIYANSFSTYAISCEEVKSLEDEDTHVSVGGGGSAVSKYAITETETVNGKLTLSSKESAAGQTVTITVTPDEGYELSTLTVRDAKGNTLALTVVKAGERYTFKMPSDNVTISSTFAKEGACPKDSTCVYAKFTDAKTTEWYHDGVHFCVENGYMNGISATKFAPNGTLSRAMIVQILWNMEGKPVADYAMTFKDVPEDQWYTEAIRWAQSTKVVEGYNDDAFGPDNDVTREQLAAILYRYAKYKGYDMANTAELAAFNDKNSISSWALDSVKWANAEGIITGRTTTTIVPEGNATRAEAASMVQRFCENVAK